MNLETEIPKAAAVVFVRDFSKLCLLPNLRFINRNYKILAKKSKKAKMSAHLNVEQI